MSNVASRFAPDGDELVVFDSPGNGKRADEIRKRGGFTIGGGLFNDAIDQSIDYTNQLLEMAGIPHGGNEGLEVGVEGWFNGDEWVYHSITSTFVDTRLLTGDLGPQTQGMGSAMFFYRHAKPKLFKETLYRLTGVLRRVDYRGPISALTRGGSVVELRPSFDMNTLNVMTHLLDTEVGKGLSDCARGQGKQWKVSFAFGVGVKVTVPPFPCNHDGDNGIIGTVVGTGSTINEARRVAYGRIRAMDTPNLQYRLDIGERAVREIPQLLREVSDGNRATVDDSTLERSPVGNLASDGEQ
jgi:hypothetical protein